MTPYKYNVLSFNGQAALTDYPVELDGELIIYKEGNVALKIALDEDHNSKIELYPKQYISGPFNRFFITTEAKGNFKLFVSKPKSIDLGSNELESDFDIVRSLKKCAFIGDNYQAAVAGQYSYLGLWNYAGSNVVAVVERLFGTWNNTDQSAYLIKHNAWIGAGGGNKGNKYLSGPDPKCIISQGSSAGALGTIIGRINKDNTSLGEPVVDAFKVPFIIPEGYGLYVRNISVNYALYINLQWTEI
jgi:hypothetical protein